MKRILDLFPMVPSQKPEAFHLTVWQIFLGLGVVITPIIITGMYFDFIEFFKSFIPQNEGFWPMTWFIVSRLGTVVMVFVAIFFYGSFSFIALRAIILHLQSKLNREAWLSEYAAHKLSTDFTEHQQQ